MEDKYSMTYEKFRALLESYLILENERLKSEWPDAGTLGITGNGVTRVPWGIVETLSFQKPEGNSEPFFSMSKKISDMMDEYQDWMSERRRGRKPAGKQPSDVQGRGAGRGSSVADEQEFFRNQFDQMEEGQRTATDYFSNPQKAMEGLIPCVCPAGTKFLADVPHYDILDLSIYYRTVIMETGLSRAASGRTAQETSLLASLGLNLSMEAVPKESMLVTGKVLELWNEQSGNRIRETDLRERAYENASAQQAILALSEDFIVATNKMDWHGASAVFMGIGIKEFAQSRDQNYYILPSSVHDLILVPTYQFKDPKDLSKIVTDINWEMVDFDDRLNDNVYCYDRNTKKLSIAYDADAAAKRRAQEFREARLHVGESESQQPRSVTRAMPRRGR